ncbi:MAG TPA: hypothetical protein EYQ05_15555 [Gammaproteobacteria bacterium]|nr:hypothetical protein [Gammaproteobacteria bacterium]HIM04469.1 hypothetical protein [Gammaproteobacteria bacterium]
MTGIGSKMIRRDARVRATGEVKFTEDFIVPGKLHTVLVRSPLASARIVNIDTAAAEEMEGVVCVLTSKDVTDRCYGNYLQDQQILASGVVRFVGDPVAMVAATSLPAARKAAAHVHIELDPLPRALDLTAAVSDDSPTVHGQKDNILDSVEISRGEVEAAFLEAHAIVTTRVETHRVYHGYLEPRAVIAIPKSSGLSIIMSTQQPYGVRIEIAQLFDLPIGNVEVLVPAIGGGFGGKLHLGLAPQAVAMALATGKPVQIICERAEDFCTGNPRENSIVELSSAVDAQGRLLGRRCDLLLDSGAYAFDTPILNSMAAFYATGPYEVENINVKARAVYSNTCPTGSMRGPTGPQMVYAVETHIDDIAGELNMDPAEVRRRNFIREGERGPMGELMQAETTAETCMDTVLKRLDSFRADAAQGDLSDPRPRGYGYACAWWSTMGTPSSATIELHEDGSATLSSGGTEIGTGVISTTLPEIVAAELGISSDRVALRSGSTRDAPFESGSRGSRTLFATGNAVLIAARDVVSQIKAEASLLLNLPADSLVLQNGRVEIADLKDLTAGIDESSDIPNSSLPLAEVVVSAKMRSGPVVATGRYRAAYPLLEGSTLDNARFPGLGEPTFHCHGVEIALDEETGRIEVLRYVAVHEAGKILNPVGARSQIEGGIAQGIGYALTENLQVDENGAVRNDNFHDYRMLTIADAPMSIETIFIETHESATGPFGARGLGEPPVILPAAAIGSAIRDILGSQPTKLPFDAASMASFVETTGARINR